VSGRDRTLIERLPCNSAHDLTRYPHDDDNQDVTVRTTQCGSKGVTLVPEEQPYHVYLPTIMKASGEAAQQFQLQHKRLWSAQENGAQPGYTCGGGQTVRVFVYNINGEYAPGAQLPGVTITATHFRAGHTTSETRRSDAAGMVEFEVYDYAFLAIVADADGTPVTSDAAQVTTLPQAIESLQLIEAGYCSDEAGCQRFRDARTCLGHFSWDVVFKRGY